MKVVKYLALVTVLTLLFIGCTTSSQRTAFNTISSVEAAGSAAVDAYYAAVLRGQIPTNDVPKVATAFNAFQQAVILAAVADQNSSNAIAPVALSAELGQLLILTATVATNFVK